MKKLYKAKKGFDLVESYCYCYISNNWCSSNTKLNDLKIRLTI